MVNDNNWVHIVSCIITHFSENIKVTFLVSPSLILVKIYTANKMDVVLIVPQHFSWSSVFIWTLKLTMIKDCWIFSPTGLVKAILLSVLIVNLFVYWKDSTLVISDLLQWGFNQCPLTIVKTEKRSDIWKHCESLKLNLVSIYRLGSL